MGVRRAVVVGAGVVPRLVAPTVSFRLRPVRGGPSTRHEMRWWGGEDSNLRSVTQQIYSLPPLTTREPPHGSRRPRSPWRRHTARERTLITTRVGGRHPPPDGSPAAGPAGAIHLELAKGLEPPTLSLQVRRSTD